MISTCRIDGEKCCVVRSVNVVHKLVLKISNRGKVRAFAVETIFQVSKSTVNGIFFVTVDDQIVSNS